MIKLEPRYLNQVKEILRRHLNPDVKVYVFGSRITDKFKEYSDLDLAVNIGNTKIESKIIGNLKTDFENSLIPIKVDVVDLNDISKEFKEIVLKRCEQLLF